MRGLYTDGSDGSPLRAALRTVFGSRFRSVHRYFAGRGSGCFDLLPYVNLNAAAPRVRSRTVTGFAIGYERMRQDRRVWDRVFQISIVTNRTALQLPVDLCRHPSAAAAEVCHEAAIPLLRVALKLEG